MTKEKYIDTVLKHISNKAIRPEIKAELEGHIDDRTEYFKNIGYDDEKAAACAIEKMGDADKTGAELDKLNERYYLAFVGFGVLYVCWILAIICFISGSDFFPEFNFLHEIPQPLSFDTLLSAAAAFIESVLLFRMIKKHRLQTGALTYGITSIISGIVCPIIYMTFGYGIVGFFMDFPAEFIYRPAPKFDPMKGYLVERYVFSGNSFPSKTVFGDGLKILTDNQGIINIVYWASAVIVILFAFYAIIVGIASIVMHVKMKKEKFDGKNKHLNRLVSLVTVIMIIGAVTCSAEIIAPFAEEKYNTYKCSQSFEKDNKNITEFALSLKEDNSEENLINLLEKYGYLYEYAPVEVEKNVFENQIHIYANENFSINVLITDGKAASWSINNFYYENLKITREKINSYDTSLPSNELIKGLTLGEFSSYDYWINTETGSTEEHFYFYAKYRDENEFSKFSHGGRLSYENGSLIGVDCLY